MLDTPRTVREVTDRIRDLFDSDPVLADLWISGEVLESTVSRSGHVFFTLVRRWIADALRDVPHERPAPTLPPLPRMQSAWRMARSRSTQPRARYQFYVDLVEEAGIGLAALELELLRQQLEAEGLFSESRKRPIPANPGGHR